MLYFSRASSPGNLKSDKVPLRNSYLDLIQIQGKSCVLSFLLFAWLVFFLSLLQIFMQVTIIVIMKGTTGDEMVGWHH